ncbi:MAG: acyl carrier protein [Salibacteraceae bacterium]|jgi:acyl carrier protein
MTVTIEKLREILEKTSNNLANEINVGDSMREQGVDSLDLMDFYLNLEDEYNVQIPDQDIEKLSSLNDFQAYIQNKI